MTTITQSITPLPAAPDPASMSPSVFSSTAAAFVLAQKAEAVELEAFRGQVNTVAGEVNANAATAVAQVPLATAQAVLAAASAATAQATAAAIMWVAATNYALGVCAISPTDFQTYRRRVAGTTATDPSADPTNWAQILYARAWITKSAAYTAVVGDRIKADTLTVGAFNITLPPAPNDGDQVEVMDIKSSFDVANCALLGNGKTVMGNTTLFLNLKNLHRVFTYDATLGDWRI